MEEIIQFRSDLYKLLPTGAHVAEIGVAEGLFSADILRWPNVKRLWMVDVWQHIPNIKGDGNSPHEWHVNNFFAAKERVKEFGERAHMLKGKSNEMTALVPDNSLDLVYLDADHSYEGVMSDLINWYPKLKKGGVMAGHDYLNPAYGVKQAVEEFQPYGSTIHIIPEHKEEDAGFYFIKY